MDTDHDLRLVGAEADVRVVVADFADRVERDLLPVDLRLGGDFTGDDDEVRGGQRLAGDAAVRVLHETGVENRIGNLVTDLVRMSFGNGLGGEDVIGMDLAHSRLTPDIEWFFILFRDNAKRPAGRMNNRTSGLLRG